MVCHSCLSRRGQWTLFAFCAAIAFGFLLVGTKSSPLYPINDWVDVNCFMTVGRSMLSGMVPYRDLMEQKGPVLYLLFALAALIDSTGYWGTFLLEWAAMTVFCFYGVKTAALLAPGPGIWAVPPLLCAVVVESAAFTHGGSAEELVLPLLAVSLYDFFRAILLDQTLSFRRVALNGALAGAIFWIKYTMIGFHFAWMACLFFHLLRRRDIRRAFLSCLVFLGGMGLVTLPILLYFAANGALGHLFTAYFYDNLFLYAPAYTLAQRAKRYFLILWTVTKRMPALVGLGALGFGGLLARRDLPRAGKLAYLSLFFFLTATVWGAGTLYLYYPLVLGVFLIPFAAMAAGWLARLPGRWAPPLACGLLSAVLALTLIPFGNNNAMAALSREELVQTRFSTLMRESSPQPTLLNYGFLDGGFYLAAGAKPNCRYFCTLNVPLPEAEAVQHAMMAAGAFDFVVTRDALLPEEYPYILAAQQVQAQEGFSFTYRLYRNRAL